MRPTHWGLGWKQLLGGVAAWATAGAGRRIVPVDLAIAAVVTGPTGGSVYRDVVLPVIAEVTGIAVPVPRVPPSQPSMVDPESYLGEYHTMYMVHRVEAERRGPGGHVDPERGRPGAGRTEATVSYAHLGADTFIRTEAENGAHDLITFVMAGGRAKRALSGLAPGGVYLAFPVTREAGGLLHHRFTLTCPAVCARHAPGGLFSVALACGLPRVGVTHHPALRSPDVPRATCVTRGRLVNPSAVHSTFSRPAQPHRGLSGLPVEI